VGKKPKQPALKQAAPAIKELPEVTDKAAAAAWEDARDNSPNFPSYDELHPKAQKLLPIEMEQANGELTGKKFRTIVATHKDALRSERIAKEVKDELDPDAFMYRKGEAALEATHAKSEAEALVSNVTQGWKNPPRVEVKQLHELSPADRERAVKEGAQGFYHDGKVTIVHEHNTNLSEVKATLFHEALGHYGLRSKFGGELKSLLEKIYDTNPEARRMADIYMKDNKGVSKALAMEEALAERQIKGQVPQGILSRITAFIRDFARRAGMKLDYSDNDIASILHQASKEVSEGSKKDWAPMEESALLRKKESGSHKDIPADLKVTLEREGPNGEVIEEKVKARATMREAERRVNILEALKECLG
jgi:hypothetical protein